MEGTPELNSSEEQIQKLSEQVKLQVGAYEAMAEVYEKYSLALARIMELLRQLHDGIKDVDHNSEQHFTEILTCVTIVGESIKHAEEAIRLDGSVFTQRVNDLDASLDRLIHKIENTNNDIIELKKSVLDFCETINVTTESTRVMVSDLHQQKQKQAEFWKKWRIWLYAIIAVVGIIETLIQFGIVKLTWF